MSWRVTTVLILTTTFSTIAGAQSLPTKDQKSTPDTQARGFWVDPATGLMWSAKDNGKDVSWHKAINYCRSLRLAGYVDWRLASLGELEGIYDESANTPGRSGTPAKDTPSTWHVKGNIFLTGNQWSSTRLGDDRGHPSGYASRFDFNEGRVFNGDELWFFTNKRALCVRGAQTEMLLLRQ